MVKEPGVFAEPPRAPIVGKATAATARFAWSRQTAGAGYPLERRDMVVGGAPNSNRSCRVNPKSAFQ